MLQEGVTKEMLEVAECIENIDGIEVRKSFAYGETASASVDVEMKDCSDVNTNASPEIANNAQKQA